MFKHILIPTDGSQLAEIAVDFGITFAKSIGARVTGFVALPEYRLPSAEQLAAQAAVTFEIYEKQQDEKAQSVLARMARLAIGAGVEFDREHALSDRPYEAIVDAATRRNCDLIFMSSHGRSGLSMLLHGSQAVGVLSHSKIPTLIYR